MSKIKISVQKPYIAYPGSTLQQNYAEDLVHGYLLWNIDNAKSFDVSFHKLPNPQPFITFDWQGSVALTVDHARKNFPEKSRFRIYSKIPLSQKEVVDLTKSLREQLSATEVTFKTDQHVNRDVIISGATTVIKEDLRSTDVLMKLIREYHHEQDVDSGTWNGVQEHLKCYLVNLSNDMVRNTKWSLKHLKFDNTFAYGEGNVINFENMNGIVGIFGPNRSGKSSVVGTIMYALHNSTDRGSMKNLHVINARKPYCYTRAIINVNGTDYAIERQTIKNENKRGQIHASTALNVFKIENGEAIDLAGEQRSDTEKVIKGLIGTSEDFLMTSLSAQDEIKTFIMNGSTRRKQILSKFLDLDIFDKMYEMAKNDFNSEKAIIKSLPDRDWMKLDEQCHKEIEDADNAIDEKNQILHDLTVKVADLRRKLEKHVDFTPVTKTELEQQRNRVQSLSQQLADISTSVESARELIEKTSERITKIDSLRNEHSLEQLREKLAAIRSLESSIVSLRHIYDKESSTLKQHERSLKILDDVPCGDQFPTCKFIKDAHALKDKVSPQREKVTKALEKLTDAQSALQVISKDNVEDQVKKIEQLNEMHSKLLSDVSTKKVELSKLEVKQTTLESDLSSATKKLLELEEALRNDENAEVVAIRSSIDESLAMIKKLDTEKLALASSRGRAQTILEKHAQERLQRSEVLHRLKAYELITTAFSKKGIPSVIISSQLPIINAEIAKILQGIVDFTVELESDDESDSMEVYIDYGDSRRIIELGSGMEKMIASVAIRVALVNVSSLPKTDMFVIDEGFGALDESGVEACNRLLTSLKRYFKTIIVITHVEGVKDAADIVLEVTKNEKDARVLYQ